MKGIPFRLEDWLSTPEERMAYAEALHEDLARGLRDLGVEAGDRPLRLAVAELARLPLPQMNRSCRPEVPKKGAFGPRRRGKPSPGPRLALAGVMAAASASAVKPKALRK